MNKILIKEIWFEEKDLLKNIAENVKSGQLAFVMVLFNDSSNGPILIPEFYCNKNKAIARRDVLSKKVIPSKKLIKKYYNELIKNSRKYYNEVIKKDDLKYIYVCRKKCDKFAVGIVGSASELRFLTPKELKELRKTIIT